MRTFNLRNERQNAHCDEDEGDQRWISMNEHLSTCYNFTQYGRDCKEIAANAR